MRKRMLAFVLLVCFVVEGFGFLPAKAASGITLPVAEKESSTFLNSGINKGFIYQIKFVSSNVVPDGASGRVTLAGEGAEAINMWWDIVKTDAKIVYIGQNGGVRANPNSSYLFDGLYNLGATQNGIGFVGMDNLITTGVTNMEGMFRYAGQNSMTSLDLGKNFNTSSVTSMEDMFRWCGKEKLTSLSLGKEFNTSSVTDMTGMFAGCGSEKLTSLSLGDKFDTSSVEAMLCMFQYCGQNSSFSLDLGEKFNTDRVKTMNCMFGSSGCNSINLGEQFDTSKVQNMSYMFSGCGVGKLTSLNLGDHFSTQSATELVLMFNKCGENSLTELNLGPAFMTSSALYPNYNDMFDGTGSSTTKIYTANQEVADKVCSLISSSPDSKLNSATVMLKKNIATPEVLKDTKVDYTGTPVSFAKSVTVAGGVVYYGTESIDAANYKKLGSTTIPSYVNPGSYTIYYYIAASSFEYNNGASGKFIFTINRVPEKTTEAAKETSSVGKEIAPGYVLLTNPDNGVGTVSYTGTIAGKKNTISIPTTITVGGKGYKVTEIAPRAFYKNKKLKKITIGNNIEKIGNEAFYGCKKLSKVSIGTGLREIGKKVFAKDTKLRTMKIKSTKLKKVGSKTLEKCTKLTIKVPKKKVKAYKKLFSKKGQRKKVIIKK